MDPGFILDLDKDESKCTFVSGHIKRAYERIT